eukprot:3934853-Rhodomonas_salina.1
MCLCPLRDSQHELPADNSRLFIFRRPTGRRGPCLPGMHRIATGRDYSAIGWPTLPADNSDSAGPDEFRVDAGCFNEQLELNGTPGNGLHSWYNFSTNLKSDRRKCDGLWSVKGRKWRELHRGATGNSRCDQQNDTFALPPREHLHPVVLAFVQVASTIRIPPRIQTPSKRFSTCPHRSHRTIFVDMVVFMTIADVGAALATIPDTGENGCERSEKVRFTFAFLVWSPRAATSECAVAA